MKASEYKRIVVLSGAGISAESGIATFRDQGGLWEQVNIEDVATPEAFEKDPKLVWRFYSARRRALNNAKPNAAHHALARFALWCDKSQRRFTLVTQNVDTLHEQASLEIGAPPPLAMHGTLGQSSCVKCRSVFWDPHAWFDDDGNPREDLMPLVQEKARRFGKLPLIDAGQIRKSKTDSLPLSPCCGVLLRPKIVWFGEIPLFLSEIEEATLECDLFVSVGTSGAVYPAAGFIQLAKSQGAKTVCLNKEALEQAQWVDLHLEGQATQLVPDFFAV